MVALIVFVLLLSKQEEMVVTEGRAPVVVAAASTSFMGVAGRLRRALESSRGGKLYGSDTPGFDLVVVT